MFVQPKQKHNSDKMPIALPSASLAASPMLAVVVFPGWQV